MGAEARRRAREGKPTSLVAELLVVSRRQLWLQWAWASLDVFGQFLAPLGMNRLVDAIEHGDVSVQSCLFYAALVALGESLEAAKAAGGASGQGQGELKRRAALLAAVRDGLAKEGAAAQPHSEKAAGRRRLDWPLDNRHLDFTTQAAIVPNVFPFPDCQGADCYGTLV